MVGMAPPRVVRGPGGPLLGGGYGSTKGCYGSGWTPSRWWVWLHQGLLGVRVDPFSVVGIEALATTRLFSKSKLFRTSMERDP